MKHEITKELNDLINKTCSIEAKQRALTSASPLIAGRLSAIVDMLPDTEENRACLINWINMFKEELK